MPKGRKSEWSYEDYCEWFYAQTVEFDSGLEYPCMLWLGRRNGEHSRMRYKGRQYQPHQVSWILEYGELPVPPLQINHKCNEHQCVNNDHLYAGTPKENGRDLSASGNWKGNNFQRGLAPHPMLGRKRTPEERARIAAGVKRAHEERRRQAIRRGD